jgi:hypothetical protein
MLIDEGNFLLAKIDWAANGSSGILISGSYDVLSISRVGNPATIVFRGQDGFLKINNIPLNNSNTQIKNLIFSQSESGALSKSFTAEFTLQTRTANGQFLSREFKTVNYVR